MANNNNRSAVKGTWNFLVGIANIISCVVAVVSCYIAYTAVVEIINLNIEIAPVVERFKKDSIIIEKTIISESPTELKKQESETMSDSELDDSKFLPSTEVDNIMIDKAVFLERMQKLFKK